MPNVDVRWSKAVLKPAWCCFPNDGCVAGGKTQAAGKHPPGIVLARAEGLYALPDSEVAVKKVYKNDCSLSSLPKTPVAGG